MKKTKQIIWNEEESEMTDWDRRCHQRIDSHPPYFHIHKVLHIIAKIQNKLSSVWHYQSQSGTYYNSLPSKELSVTTSNVTLESKIRIS